MTETPSKAPSPTWAVSATLEGVEGDVLAFVAHHLVLGAASVVLYAEDVTGLPIDRLKARPEVRVVTCDATYWTDRAGRPEPASERRKVNALDAYMHCTHDWIIDLTVLEFAAFDMVPAQRLAMVEGNALRLCPYERLNTGKHGFARNPSEMFRGAVERTPEGRHIARATYGDFFLCLSAGMMSNPFGSYFIRSGLSEATLLASASHFGGKKYRGEVAKDARLYRLGFDDYAQWFESVTPLLDPAVGGTLAKTLQQLWADQGEDGLKEFFATLCSYHPKMRGLHRYGALRSANLWLDEKRDDIFADPPGLWNFALDPQTGQLEMDGLLDDLRMRLVPDNNFTESRIARAMPPEETERHILRDLVAGKRVLFYDIGANAGIYALSIARHATRDSEILAVEPNPEMLRRLRRNIALNGFISIDVIDTAIGRGIGTTVLAGHNGRNLGEAHIANPTARGITVDLCPLPHIMRDPAEFEMVLLKIDVEGHEDAVLQPLLDIATRAEHLPNYIMLEHISKHRWSYDLLHALNDWDYQLLWSSDRNLILRRGPAQ